MRFFWYLLLLIFLGAFVYWAISIFKRKKNRRDDSNKEGRIALSDDSWIEEVKKMNPRPKANGD